MLEASERKVKTSDVIRFVGGGALNDFTCQLLADITGHTIETVDSPQNVGAVGAAVCVAIGLNLIPSFDKVKDFIPAKKTFKPNLKLKAEVYDKGFEVFKNLYKANNRTSRCLTETTNKSYVAQDGRNPASVFICFSILCPFREIATVPQSGASQ